MTIAQIYEEAKRQLDEGVITIGEFSEIVDREYQEPILDKISAEIELHRRKTESIDPYDLVGDCLDIIEKYKKVESEG